MHLKTRVRSAAMRYFASARYQQKLNAKARRQRRRRGDPPCVYYFHQADDPYSHLAIQKLDQLRAHYDVAFQPHLVTKPDAAYLGSAKHFTQWAQRDAMSIAADYGTTFPATADMPSAAAVAQANRQLAGHLQDDAFAQVAYATGEALWSGSTIASSGSTATAEQALQRGNGLRRQLGHYQGGMFYFDGEWFWGIDRIRLLEARLSDEGLSHNAQHLCVPEPTAVDTSHLNTSTVLLEYFPSLRSPYTAIGHPRLLQLIDRSGVSVQVRPVMPMLMRGIPAPRLKQRYIITDAGREARAHGVPFGSIVDPFGEPVRRAFALFPGAAALNKEMAFVSAYLEAAWFSGIDITTEQGLQAVAAKANIDWAQLVAAAQGAPWQTLLDTNLNAMLADNLWGVPSFRVSGGNREQSFACWGQDRLWRVENEIAKRV